MYHWLIIGSILSGLSAAQLIAYPASAFGTCSYTGDPHLIPFPTSPGQVSNMYFCPITGWQIVLQNQWVLIAVQSSTTPYVILDVSISYSVLIMNPIDFFYLSMSSSFSTLIVVLLVY
jgi:hypothetical protein